jgi:hypothetical protein
MGAEASGCCRRPARLTVIGKLLGMFTAFWSIRFAHAVSQRHENGYAPGKFGVFEIGNLRRFCAGFTQLHDSNPQLTALSAGSFLGLKGPWIEYLPFNSIFIDCNSC